MRNCSLFSTTLDTRLVATKEERDKGTEDQRKDLELTFPDKCGSKSDSVLMEFMQTLRAMAKQRSITWPNPGSREISIRKSCVFLF